MAVFYLKYRPQKIAELDLVAVREMLSKVLNQAQKPHAFLFCGPKGTGKTSAARILAKAVNCLKNGGIGEPCNRCDMCQEITEGRAIDLYEIDAASNRGIDDIRQLRERIKLAAARAKKKVYIIDEVHMLTTEAFNALLKTLEEPPEHAMFILCTTAVQKLPETIVSRCMRFNFKRAAVGEIIASLKRVVRGEKIKAEEKALWEIAKAASGSFRDATKLLEQASLMQKEVTAETVLKILGQLEGFRPIELLKMLARREAKGAIEWLGLATQAGVDLKILLESLIEDLRKMLLLSVGVVEENEQGFERLMTTEEIKRLISLLMAAAKEGGTAFVPQLPLEMAIIEWCGEKAGGEGKVEKVEQVEKVGKAPKEEVALGGKTAENKEEGEKVGFLEIEKKWNQVLVGLRAINHSVEALLRSCRPAEISGNLLTIEVFYKFHKERLETAAYREMVEKAFFDLLGRPLRLRWVLREKKKEGKEENISGNQIGDDIIRAAEEIFGGKVD